MTNGIRRMQKNDVSPKGTRGNGTPIKAGGAKAPHNAHPKVNGKGVKPC